MDITWDEAEELATNTTEWRQRVAQCIHLDAELTKVTIQYGYQKLMNTLR